MPSVWSYEGKKVVVSGGGGAGMGAAAVRHLAELGAEIHVLDLKEPPVDVAGYYPVDLKDPAAIEATVATIGRGVDALFNCAGLPGGARFTDLDTMLVNFVALRHLTDLIAEGMQEGAAIASISSSAGAGWQGSVEKWMPLVTSDGFEGGRQWLIEHPDEIAGGYAQSKEVIIIWTLWRSFELAKRGIRINCTSPGPTDTPMMPDFEAMAGKEFMENYPIPLGRRSTPDEQGYPLIFLNSPAASFITGENLTTDAGTMSALAVGTLDVSAFGFGSMTEGDPS